MAGKDPPHPGAIIRSACLEANGLTVAAAARLLGVARPTLSALVNGHAGVTPEMALRPEKAFGERAEEWLYRQARYDLARARRSRAGLEVARYRPPQADLFATRTGK